MINRSNDTPINDEDMIQAWAKQPELLEYIRNHGWAAANRRRHDITSCARTFANQKYAAQDDLRQGFFEGVAFALLADLRVADIKGLTLHLTLQPQVASESSLDNELYDTAATGGEIDPIDDTAREAAATDGPHDGGGSEPPAV